MELCFTSHHIFPSTSRGHLCWRHRKVRYARVRLCSERCVVPVNIRRRSVDVFIADRQLDIVGGVAGLDTGLKQLLCRIHHVA